MVVARSCLGVVDSEFVSVLVEFTVSLLEVIVVELLSSNPIVSVSGGLDAVCRCMESYCWCWWSSSSSHLGLVFQIENILGGHSLPNLALQSGPLLLVSALIHEFSRIRRIVVAI
jgi:hypothetical protein